MCGICGVINFDNKPIQETSIRNMMYIMKHRGPDDEGVFIDETIGLGFVRLSIIDLSPAGHQPMFSDDGRYVMVFNGEIYNFIEIKKELQKKGYNFKTQSDSEVLLTSFIEWGEACLHRFNGMWAFVIYDRIEKNIFAARDRYGIKPFYYLHTDELFAFCSEIPPLLSLLHDKPKPNYQSIFDFLVFNRTDQTENTFFNEVKKLQHGYQIRIDLNRLPLGRIKVERWYNLRENVSKTDGFKNVSEFKELLSSSIGFRLRSDVPLGVCFSGGLDSSSIVSILLQDYNKQDLNTFSAIYNKGDIGDESEFINEYESLLKNMFYISPTGNSLEKDLMSFVKAHAEPIPGTSPYAQFKVMELAKGKVVVTLDGQGADESLAGYHYFFGFFFMELIWNRRFGKLCNEILKYCVKHKSILGLKSLVFFLLSERGKTEVRINEYKYLNSLFVSKYKSFNHISGNLYGAKSLNDALLDHFEYKLEHLLKWEDRNSMWFSIEARVPFLDYRLVEKTLATSGDMMIKNGMTKYLLRESLKGVLPENIRMRRDKVGFATPQNEWFRSNQWSKLINDILDSASFRSRNIVDVDKAKHLFQRHMDKRVNAAMEIWKMVHLELWFREFID